MAFFSDRALAAVYYLNPAKGNDANPGTQGSPWKTLSKVKTTVAAGDTVNIVGGTYTQAQVAGESGVPTWSHTHSLGTAQHPITIQANPGDTVIFDGQLNGYWQRFYASGPYAGHYVIVKNLTFKRYGAAIIGVTGTSTAAAHHVAILGCTFQDVSQRQSAPLSTYFAHHVIFQGNTIKNIGDPTLGGDGLPFNEHGIYVSDNSQFVVLDHNTIEQISGHGVHAWNAHGTTNTTKNIIMRKNVIMNMRAAGMIRVVP